MTRRQATGAFLTVLIGLIMGPIRTVAAHEGGEAVVEIQPSRIVAGSTIQIVGDGFTPDTTVSLTLLTSESVPLGSAVADDEGHFVVSIVSDDDWASRPYEVSVVADDGGAAAGFFTVLEAPDDSNSNAELIAGAGGLAGIFAVVAVLVLLRRRGQRLA